MKKAIIVSSSQRRLIEEQPIPALERYTGVNFRVIRKYRKKGKLQNIDVLIVSEKYGVIKETQKIPYDKPFKTFYVAEEELDRLRKRNLEKLREIFTETEYSEIFVNVGRRFLSLIEGFESLTSAKVTYASGKGLGVKARSLKEWIMKQK